MVSMIEHSKPATLIRETNNRLVDSVPLPSPVVLAYRVNDATKVSRLSRSSLYELMAEQKLRSVTIAGRRLISADALRELFEGAA
jgi:hypothetical protein